MGRHHHAGQARRNRCTPTTVTRPAPSARSCSAAGRSFRTTTRTSRSAPTCCRRPRNWSSRPSRPTATTTSCAGSNNSAPGAQESEHPAPILTLLGGRREHRGDAGLGPGARPRLSRPWGPSADTTVLPVVDLPVGRQGGQAADGPGAGPGDCGVGGRPDRWRRGRLGGAPPALSFASALWRQMVQHAKRTVRRGGRIGIRRPNRRVEVQVQEQFVETGLGIALHVLGDLRECAVQRPPCGP